MESTLLIVSNKDGWNLVDNPNWIETFPEYFAQQLLISNPTVKYVEYKNDGKIYRVIRSSDRTYRVIDSNDRNIHKLSTTVD